MKKSFFSLHVTCMNFTAGLFALNIQNTCLKQDSKQERAPWVCVCVCEGLLQSSVSTHHRVLSVILECLSLFTFSLSALMCSKRPFPLLKITNLSIKQACHTKKVSRNRESSSRDQTLYFCCKDGYFNMGQSNILVQKVSRNI